MRTIYKYPLMLRDHQQLEVPAQSKPLMVGLDPQGTPCLWCEVTPANPMEKVIVHIVGTGNPVPDRAIHFGSFIQQVFVRVIM